MSLLKFVEAFAVAAVIVFHTDWYFFGRRSLHLHYGKFPAVWKKYKDKREEIRAIVFGELISFAACAVFIATAGTLGVHGLGPAAGLALAFWGAGPLLLLLSLLPVMNLDRVVFINHAAGWLVRFLAAALGAGLFLN
jgi:hypothetical protein